MTHLNTRAACFAPPAALTASTTIAVPTSDYEVAAAERALNTILAHYRRRAGRVSPRSECLKLIGGQYPKAVRSAFAELSPEWADHAIATVYAILMPHRRRKRLGAYFTPPHLVGHLLSRMAALGVDIARQRLRDPAAGGAAFLVPLARRMVAAWRNEGVSNSGIVSLLRRRLAGMEVERGLTDIANALLRRMLVREYGFRATTVSTLKIVRSADALSQHAFKFPSDHEMGNPPYRRLSADEHVVMRERFADIASGRLNLYAMFMRRAITEVPPGGLVGHIVPASFLGGPEFTAFRQRMLELAEVLVVDVVDQRSKVFIDAIQDACFVVLRRRAEEVRGKEGRASSGVLRSDGRFVITADMRLAPDGSPWQLPGMDTLYGTTLADWGYRASVGYLVAYRDTDRMHNRPAKGRLPLIWARAVGSDGTFDHARGASANRPGWVSVAANAPYVVRSPCVVVQRTSSRDQRRRITAAAVPEEFLRRHGGVVGENHVILLVRTRPDAVPPEALAEALNSLAVSSTVNRLCGSASIPLGALQSLRLPMPPKAPCEPTRGKRTEL